LTQDAIALSIQDYRSGKN